MLEFCQMVFGGCMPRKKYMWAICKSYLLHTVLGPLCTLYSTYVCQRFMFLEQWNQLRHLYNMCVYTYGAQSQIAEPLLYYFDV